MLKKVPLAERAFHELANRIISGVLPAGTHLTEESVCNELGISRTPAREALRLLVADRLAEALPRRGVRVCSLDREALEEMFQCRIELEVLALRASIGRLPKERLRMMRDVMTAAVDEVERRRLSLELDNQLHDILLEFCGNRYIGEFARQLRRRSLPFRDFRNSRSGIGEQVDAERLGMIDALLREDVVTAEARLRAHILAGMP